MDAIIHTAEDPLDTFVNSIQNEEVRNYIKDTIRLRQNLLSNMQRMLVSSNPSEVAGYATWIARNAHEVGYRWFALRHSLERWMALRCDPMIILRKTGAEDGPTP